MAITLDGTAGITSIGVTTIPDGTAAAPSLKLTAGGTQLGLYTASNNYIGVASRGLPAVEIGGGDDGGQHGDVVIYGNSNASYGGGITWATSRGTRAAPTIVQNGDELGWLWFQGYDGSAYHGVGYITCSVDGVPGAGDIPTALNFYTTPDGSANYSLRMKIDQAGNVGIGTSSPTAKLHVSSPTNNIISSTGLSGYGAFYAASSGSNASYVFFGDAGGEKGRITSYTDGTLTFGNTTNNTERMLIDSSGNVGIGMTPVAKLDVTGTIRGSTTIGVGGATPAASGAGITFPATQSASTDANTLDDYEEGTFTPTISGTTIAGAGTYTTQTGRYTKIGRMVYITGLVAITAHTGTGNMRVSDLPFTTFNSSALYPLFPIDATSLTVPANSIPFLQVVPNVTYADMRSWATAATSSNSFAMDVACSIYFNLTYEVA